MSRLKMSAFVFLLLAPGLDRVSARAVSDQPLLALIKQSDAIVVGTMNIIVTAPIVNISITATKTFLGSVPVGATVSVSFTLDLSLPADSTVHSSNDQCLCFLKQSGGTWSLISAREGDLDWQTMYVSLPSSVAAGAQSSVTASLPSNPSVFDRVVAELVIALEGGAPTRFDLVEIDRLKTSPVLSAAFSRFVTEQNINLVAIGLRGLLVEQNPVAIGQVYTRTASLAATSSWAELVQGIRVYYTNTSSESVGLLGGIVSDASANADLRAAAAGALARMHTPLTLPYLAALLDDPSLTLVTAAIGGLSSFANNVPIGSHEPAEGQWAFRTHDTIASSAFDENIIRAHRTTYVSFWKTWWSSNHAAISHPASAS